MAENPVGVDSATKEKILRLPPAQKNDVERNVNFQVQTVHPIKISQRERSSTVEAARMQKANLVYKVTLGHPSMPVALCLHKQRDADIDGCPEVT